MFAPIPNVPATRSLVYGWAGQQDISVSRGPGRAWFFTKDIADTENHAQGRLLWTATPDEDGNWGQIVADYTQGGQKTHRLEFRATPKNTFTYWDLESFSTISLQNMDYRILAVLWNQTGKWAKSLREADSRLMSSTMIPSAIWVKDDVLSSYLREGVRRGYCPLKDYVWA